MSTIKPNWSWQDPVGTPNSDEDRHILKAGSFRTADYRKAIPPAVKMEVLLRQGGKCACEIGAAHANCGLSFAPDDARKSNIEFNHNPPLDNRNFSMVDSDFIPPQNDPAYIRAEFKDHHAVHSRGTKATTRGSVVGESARAARLQTKNAEHADRMQAKAGHGSDRASADLDLRPASELTSADVKVGVQNDAVQSAIEKAFAERAEQRRERDQRRAKASWPKGRKLQSQGFQKRDPKQKKERFNPRQSSKEEG